MLLDDPNALELEYTVRMMGWMLFQDPDTLAERHLVTLGLGAGGLTKFAYAVLGMRTTAVEIDAEVIRISHESFLLPAASERLAIVHADAVAFMADAQRAATIDVLQIDAYDAHVELPVLDSEGFYESCRTAMRTNGTVAVNLVGRKLDAAQSVARIRKCLQPGALWQFPPTESGNVIVLAHMDAAPPEAELARRAALIEQRWDLPAREWLAMVRRT